MSIGEAKLRPSHLSRLEQHCIPEPNSGCWLWLGAVNVWGYGRFTVGHRETVAAHRASYVLHRGSIPGRLFVCHRCDVPSCVNPDHLFLGTHKENMRDMTIKGRRVLPAARSGERNPAAKLTKADAIAILGSTESGKDTAQQYGVSQSLISAIRLGKLWSYLGPRVQKEAV